MIYKNKNHGLIKHPLYYRWTGMKDRCYNLNAKDRDRYGARGITVCDEWKNDFMSFYNWAMDNGYKEGLSLDRINVNGNYEPTNCRWITMFEQQSNKTTNKKITFKNKTQTLSEWGRELNIDPDRIGNRLSSGWTIEDALTKPVKSPITNKIPELGHLIKQDRTSKGLNQSDYGKIFKVKGSLISRWENGLRYPTTEHIGKILEILNIEGDVL